MFPADGASQVAALRGREGKRGGKKGAEGAGGGRPTQDPRVWAGPNLSRAAAALWLPARPHRAHPAPLTEHPTRPLSPGVPPSPPCPPPINLSISSCREMTLGLSPLVTSKEKRELGTDRVPELVGTKGSPCHPRPLSLRPMALSCAQKACHARSPGPLLLGTPSHPHSPGWLRLRGLAPRHCPCVPMS